MKLKNILALAVACGAALMMSVAAHAATEVKVQGATTDEYGAVVPVVINTTDVNFDELCTVQMRLRFDSTKWSYYQTTNNASIVDKRGNEVVVGTVNAAETATGEVTIIYTNDMGVGAPAPDENGIIKLCTVTFDAATTPVPTVTDDEFSTGVYLLEDYNTGGGDNNFVMKGEEMDSFFTFDVTGNLDGNEIIGLAASIDGGATKQALTKYVSTTLTSDSTDYASATTKFLVAVNNTTDAVAKTDVTIYGLKEDGTYVPLTSLDQNDFLVQTFKYDA